MTDPTATTAPLLEISGLIKTYDDVVAVDGVDIRLGADELLALVGPSGCGKSTVLRSIAGLVSIDGGSVRLGGELVDDGSAHLPPERRPVGLVFQEHALFPHLTVRDNVGFGLRKEARGEADARVGEMLELVGLGRYGARYPHELSGGERQRVALARALAPRPALMLFDEPFASLDHNLRVQLRQDVVDALRATGTPAVFVTHDQREALAIGDRIAVMRAGRIVQLATPADVFHRPVDGFVAAFMGEVSFLPIENVDGRPRTVLGPVDATEPGVGEGWAAMVRPDDLRFDGASTDDTPPGEGPTAARAEIVAAEYQGSGWLATARLADATEVRVNTSHLAAPTIGGQGSLRLVDGHHQVVVRVEPT
ncbi:MAG: ABC transporter ATP-binding protein [Actinomycetota bacterium]